MAAEHAGAAGPDPRELIAEIREWTRHLCTRTRSTYQSIRAADALEAILARAEAAEARLRRISTEIIGGFTKAGAFMLAESDPLAPGEIGIAIGNHRAAVRRELEARIAALEAESARLYEGWPVGIDPGSVFTNPTSTRWWAAGRDSDSDLGPFATKREAIQAHLGLDAPAGGGTDA